MSASSALRGLPRSLYTITCTQAPGRSPVRCAVEAFPSTPISRGESRRLFVTSAGPILTRSTSLDRHLRTHTKAERAAVGLD